ncbi:hypothetical protein [Pedobacter endophyticus]|uniref:DUF1640 domain-containing protein n=1 Tax=Pedobacter endophyticus TaxID=2789740 RepID=A0A7S9KYJ0_9SPHI|nr:hypothetical protein [Pedobacter endophyticus]QPH39196.1 hypothetical protein IZT61_19430 [Pedobacter endophyticus]
MIVTEIQLFQILKAKLGEKEAEQLVAFVKEEVKTEFDNKREILATKDDIANTNQALANTKANIIKWMFIFSVGQIAVSVGVIAMFIDK